MPPKTPIVDFDLMRLTPEQDRLSEHFFSRMVEAVASDPAAATGPDTGVALCVACAEFLGVGMRAGLMMNLLSEERARLIVASLSRLLPKSS